MKYVSILLPVLDDPKEMAEVRKAVLDLLGMINLVDTELVGVQETLGGSGTVTFANITVTNIADVFELDASRIRVTGTSLILSSVTRFRTDSNYVEMNNLPTASPGAGTKRLWVDTAAGNVIKIAL